MNTPRFSVIVPVYNVEPWLAQCLDSLLAQTCTDWEALCIDDGSTDGSGTLADGYAARDSRFHVVHQANGGLSAARNTGLDAAHGDYILFLDSDDWLEPNALQSLAGHLHGEDMLCFSGRRIDETTGSYRPADSLAPAVYPSGMDYYNANALLPRDFPFVCVVLRCYRRQFLLDCGLRFRPGMLHEDNLFTPQACYHARSVAVMADVLYNYRLRPGSIMATRSLRSRQDMIRIANELSDFFAEKNNIDRSVVYRALTHHYQAAFAGATPADDRQLRPLVDWRAYHRVSRGRLRHRLQYLAIRTSPTLFRLLNHSTA